MKKSNIILTFLILLFSNGLQAQGFSFSNPFDGLNKTFSDFIENRSTPEEFLRLWMLTNSDIRLVLNVEPDEWANLVAFKEIGFFHRIKRNAESLECRFDWDNKALAMIGSPTQITEKFGIIGKDDNEIDIFPIKAEQKKMIQFTDQYGYWYIPAELEPDRYTYIKFHMKTMAGTMIGNLSDMFSDDYINEQLIKITDTMTMDEKIVVFDFIDYLFGYESGYMGSDTHQMVKDLKNEFNEEKLKELLRDIQKERFSSLVGFPVFIHWAFLYSPDYVKSKVDVTETQFDCYGIPGACTLLTVNSGPDKGKSLRFDPYGRLIFIDAKKEGTASFSYGHDFNVRLPPAFKIEDILTNKVYFPSN